MELTLCSAVALRTRNPANIHRMCTIRSINVKFAALRRFSQQCEDSEQLVEANACSIRITVHSPHEHACTSTDCSQKRVMSLDLSYYEKEWLKIYHIKVNVYKLDKSTYLFRSQLFEECCFYEACFINVLFSRCPSCDCPHCRHAG